MSQSKASQRRDRINRKDNKDWWKLACIKAGVPEREITKRKANMKLSKFVSMIQDRNRSNDPEVRFVGMKWQEECHPSAELFPIEFVDVKHDGSNTMEIKFITTKHNQ